MAPHPASCPSADVLTAFASGKLDDAAAAAVLSHLDACSECLRAVADQSGDDFLERLRAVRGATPSLDDTMSYVRRPAEFAGDFSPTLYPTPNLPPELRDHPRYEGVRELGAAAWVSSTWPRTG